MFSFRVIVSDVLPPNFDVSTTKHGDGVIAASDDPEMADDIIDALMMRMVFFVQAVVDKEGWHKGREQLGAGESDADTQLQLAAEAEAWLVFRNDTITMAQNSGNMRSMELLALAPSQDTIITDIQQKSERDLLTRRSTHTSLDHLSLEEQFAAMDTDGDGTLTSAEFARANRAQCRAKGFSALEAKFREIDVDGDGTITSKEFAAHHRAVSQRDINAIHIEEAVAKATEQKTIEGQKTTLEEKLVRAEGKRRASAVTFVEDKA